MAVEKDEAEHTLRRYRDDGQLMVDNERRRLERELQFKKAHEECVAQYDATVKAQVSHAFSFWCRVMDFAHVLRPVSE